MASLGHGLYLGGKSVHNSSNVNQSITDLFAPTSDFGVYLQKTNTIGNYHIFYPIDTIGNVASFEIKKLIADNSVVLHPSNFGIKKAYKAINPIPTGTFTTGYTAYTAVLNDTISLTFDGTSVDFQSYTDNRGGLWSFVVDGGEPVVKSVWAAVAAFKRVNIATGLSYGEHTIIGTFIGADPEHAPTGGIARGWVCLDTTNTYDHYHYKGLYIQDYKDFNFLHKVSQSTAYDVQYDNIESRLTYAFGVKKQGSAVAYKFIPDHDTVTTKFATQATDQILYADDTPVNLAINQFAFATKHTSIRLMQNHIGFNSNEPDEDLISVEQLLTFNYKGLKSHNKITALQNLTSENCYMAMLPLNHSIFDNSIINEVEYATILADGSNQAVGNPLSYSVNTNKAGNTVALLGIEILSGKSLAKSSFIRFADANIHKVYMNVAGAENIDANTVYEYEAMYFIANIATAYNYAASKLL